MAKIGVVLFMLTICVISPCFSYTPKANPKAIAQVTPNARFTVLTSRLIRMEWAPVDQSTGAVEFNDDATFAFIDRYMEVGTSGLCQHNFEHNRSMKALSIMPA